MWSPPKDKVKQRLEKHKEVDSKTGCWLWTGAKRSTKRGDNHGITTFGYKSYGVHRLAMYVYKDFNLNDLHPICHIQTCPNAHCFWPEHLYVGTYASNTKDLVATGKFVSGWSRKAV